MRKATLLMTFLLTCQTSKGINPTPDPSGSVTCNDAHTVDITISNVDDFDEWTAADWQLQSSDSCQPKVSGTTVTYTSLSLPDCAKTSEELNDGSIKYTLEISPVVTDSLQTRSYKHTYTVSCTYDNDDRVVASFVPIKNRADTDDSTASFTFSLNVYPQSDHTGTVPNPVALDQTLYFKASVSTASSKPNLDLYPSGCWSSKSDDPDSRDGYVTLIVGGCGHRNVSNDLSDTLSYSCASDSTDETFSIKSFRYVGASDGDTVYLHCNLKVCLADNMNSACDCPSVCPPEDMRKRRSFDEIVDESEVYHVTAGPFIFKDDKKDKKGQEKDENEKTSKQGGSDKQFQYFSTNLTIVVGVSGVIITAVVCATVYLVVRNRSRDADLSILNELTAPITSPVESTII